MLFRFQPDGTVTDVYYDTGYCAFKGTPFGDCVLQKLERVRIPPFNDRSVVEVGLDIGVEANGSIQIRE